MKHLISQDILLSLILSVLLLMLVVLLCIFKKTCEMESDVQEMQWRKRLLGHFHYCEGNLS